MGFGCVLCVVFLFLFLALLCWMLGCWLVGVGVGVGVGSTFRSFIKAHIILGHISVLLLHDF